ncbi:multiprotein-bridging factor 1 [Mucor velutinosus]|uniref:Multiprotein-bridging factor 1 n=1 Tax=Mucor velutinosus TaxID=708070 RepID=A0AAN7DK71_9FUNG|nr:multiprotein-bridging factor 1 [Mucor velutinosus]
MNQKGTEIDESYIDSQDIKHSDHNHDDSNTEDTIEDVQDNRYKCDICKYEIEGYRSFVFHLKLAHKMHYIKGLIQKHWLRIEDEEPPYTCSECQKVFKTARHYEIHRGSVHKKDLLASISKNIMPKINGPTNYCQACEATYSNKNNYKAHLRKVHRMAIINRDASIIPDPYDPEFYCRACQKKYVNKKKYRKHLYSIHNIRGVKNKLKKATITAEDSETMQTQRRGIGLDSMDESRPKTRAALRAVLRAKPASDAPRLILKPKELDAKEKEAADLEKEVNSFVVGKRKKPASDDFLPDINDPNNYCRVCDKTYSNKYGYRVHMEHLHNMKLPQLVNPNGKNMPSPILPDPHDPDYYCRVCQITNYNITAHRRHCRIVHQMVFERRYKNPDAVIDIDSPDFYCPKCEKHFEGKYYYRSHLKSVHEIVYKQAKLSVNKEVEIDIDSPDFFCGKCDKKFNEKYYFRRHLKYVHDLRYKSAKLEKKDNDRKRVKFVNL